MDALTWVFFLTSAVTVLLFCSVSSPGRLLPMGRVPGFTRQKRRAMAGL